MIANDWICNRVIRQTRPVATHLLSWLVPP